MLIAALALVAWPPLMRPLLDGDTLSYHLPNAAAWVHAHGLWTTDPRYWWYPPGSEIFAAGLFAVSGPFVLGWSGFGALALLGFRIAHWANAEFGAPEWLADALAAATVTMTPLALQAGSLQNDVWLAAFFLESLWVLRREPAAAARTIAIAALLKPYGWIFAFAAAATSRAPLRVWLAGAAAIGVWAAHDALLWHGSIVAPASTSSANTWASTILAHGLPAFALLARVAAVASPFVLPALLAAIFGPLLAGAGRRGVGWAALAAFAVFLVMPLAYADRHPQLETGASLRYAAPALALGALLLARIAVPWPRIAFVLLLLCTAFGVSEILATYWNDGGTHVAIGIAALAVGNAALARMKRVALGAPRGIRDRGDRRNDPGGALPRRLLRRRIARGRTHERRVWVDRTHATGGRRRLGAARRHRQRARPGGARARPSRCDGVRHRDTAARADDRDRRRRSAGGLQCEQAPSRARLLPARALRRRHRRRRLAFHVTLRGARSVGFCSAYGLGESVVMIVA